MNYEEASSIRVRPSLHVFFGSQFVTHSALDSSSLFLAYLIYVDVRLGLLDPQANG